MSEATKFFVAQIGERWTFGREGTAFESFPTLELAVERAKQFKELHADVQVVIVDAKGRERAV